jgi:hypothetical protein
MSDLDFFYVLADIVSLTLLLVIMADVKSLLRKRRRL